MRMRNEYYAGSIRGGEGGVMVEGTVFIYTGSWRKGRGKRRRFGCMA